MTRSERRRAKAQARSFDDLKVKAGVLYQVDILGINDIRHQTNLMLGALDFAMSIPTEKPRCLCCWRRWTTPDKPSPVAAFVFATPLQQGPNGITGGICLRCFKGSDREEIIPHAAPVGVQ